MFVFQVFFFHPGQQWGILPDRLTVQYEIAEEMSRFFELWRRHLDIFGVISLFRECGRKD
jgi:hypothetical protein